MFNLCKEQLMLAVMIASLTLFMLPLSLLAGNKRAQQEQMRTIIQVLQMETVAQAGMPAFVADDKELIGG